MLFPTIEIREDFSPMRSLLDAGFKLVYEPSIKEDYRYLVRESIFEKIGRISRALDKDDKRLIIRSVWRSFDHQRMLWDECVALQLKKYPDMGMDEIHKIVSYFIAPEKESTHTTGGAVDALIYDLKADCVMDFGTNDGLKIDLNKKCYPHHPEISAEAKENRALLIGLFEAEDFVVDLKEYWHFDFGNAGWALEKGKDHAHYGIIENQPDVIE
ncbi:D-ala-D-ala dipeptidase [Reichenbachiella faecimaris]|uniref:D-ala-D-ala dipeptidase n=2 Tax=Reichenbachiella faecimaris TaxID=692418 RepID=A0A1W2G6I7_REIFA|nr:D-ala-D-ala dipeptidase [Reichenbachiella faecimaris]